MRVIFNEVIFGNITEGKSNRLVNTDGHDSNLIL
jgi:hypothetical protein